MLDFTFVYATPLAPVPFPPLSPQLSLPIALTPSDRSLWGSNTETLTREIIGLLQKGLEVAWQRATSEWP